MDIDKREWVAAAWENLEDAVAAGNVSLAKAIIADTQDYGFLDDARRMNDVLRNATNV